MATDQQQRTIRALNILTKWRVLFTGWQLGTRPKGDPEGDAVRDHRARERADPRQADAALDEGLEAVSWLMGLVANWRARRACFHHDHKTGETWISGRLIDLGRRKLFDCRRCGRTWTA